MMNEFFMMAWTQVWQVTALVFLVLVVNRVFGSKRPHLAHLLWLVVLLKCLTPPVLATPWSPLGWVDRQVSPLSPAGSLESYSVDPNWSDSKQTQSESLPTMTTNLPTLMIESGRWTEASELRISRPNTNDSWLGSSLPPHAPSRTNGTRLASPMMAGLVIWSLSAAIVFVVFAVRCFRQLRRLAAQTESHDSDLDELVGRLEKRLGMNRHVTVVVSGDIGPAVVGLIRPKVILPAKLLVDRTLDQLEPVLAHELVHIRRGDLWFGMLQWFVQATWWFHPLVWIGNRQMNRDAERCCDEEVISELRYSPAKYARMLLDVLSMKQELDPMSPFPGVRPVDVTSQRLERIMSLEHGSRRRAPRRYIAVAVAFAVVVLPGAWSQMQAQNGDEAIGATAQSGVGVQGTTIADVKDDAGVKDDADAKNDDGQAKGLPRLPVFQASRLPVFQPPAKRAGQPWKQDRFTFETPDGPIAIRGVEMPVRNATAEPSRLITKSYAIAESIKQAEQEGLDELAIIHCLENGDLQTPASSRGHYVYDESSRRLLVRHSLQGHRRVADTIKAIDRFGFKQLTVETRVIEVPTKLIRKLGVDWQIVAMPDHHVSTVGAEFDSTEPSDQSKVTAAAFTVEKQLPALFAALDPAETERVLQTISSDKDANVVTAPRVTIFNGQRFNISDTVQRPYVVGILREHAGGHAPQIRIVEEGWRLKIRGVREKGGIWLQCDAMLTSERGVEERDLPIKIDGEPVTLQIPEVASSHVNLSAVVEDQSSLIVYGLTAGKDSGKTPLLLLTPRLVDPPDEDEENGVTAASNRYERLHIDGGVVEDAKLRRDAPDNIQLLSLLKKSVGDKVERRHTWEKMRIVKEKIADYVDPPRSYPMVGNAQLHHAHYKCTFYFEAKSSEPAEVDDLIEVIYVDHTHLIPVKRRARR